MREFSRAYLENSFKTLFAKFRAKTVKNEEEYFGIFRRVLNGLQPKFVKSTSKIIFEISSKLLIEKVFFCFLFLLVLTGCGVRQDLDIDSKISEQMERNRKEVINFWEDNKIETDKNMSLELIKEGILDETKVKIDQWIEKNNLNKYGDSKNLMYAGGTPLFNEATGEITDRYVYILNNHPELVRELQLK